MALNRHGRSLFRSVSLALYRRGSNVEKRGAPIVYVMDDDADVRDGLKALFESVGCERVINPLVNLGRERRNQHPDEQL